MKHAKTVWKFALVAISYSVGGTGSGRMPRVACRTRRLFLNSFLSMMAAGLWSGPAAAEANAALEWSAIATEAFLPTQGTDPLSQSRAYAMLHAGIHDALNAIDHRYAFYTPGMFVMPGASADAAVAAAAHDVLVALIPAHRPFIDEAYESALAAIPEGPAKDSGVLVGATAAALILERRAD